jgi:ABC-type oligopeptide transport system ATPase subunit
VIGESGSGKTTLVNAWLKSLTKEANQSGKVEVEFFQIDPKMFTKEVQTEAGRYEKMDLFAEAKGYLKSIKFANKVVVIHIDEAHLLLGTNEGTFSLTRWADLLNFITSLNDEQRKNKSRGAMFIIASTNRPDILPPEILKNPNRFSNIIEIPIPSYTDRISILKGYLQNLGMQTDHIDFEYLSGLLEGTNQSYGNVLRIVQKSVVFAKIYNSMVTTEILYKFINELIRNVTFTINKLDPYFVDQISSYYGAIASVAMQFEKVQNLYSFDMATIYPLKNEIESKNISELYAYPKPKSIQFGEVFYCKRSFQIDDFNKKIVILSLIADLVGTIYCDSVDCGLPRQAQKKLAHAYSQIYEYFASSSAEFAHIATEFQKSKQGDSATDITLTKKTTDILRKIEIEIKKFVQQSDVKQLIEKTKELLQHKKMITKKDMLEQNEIKNLLIKTEKEFKTLYNTIKNLIV